VSGTGLHAWGTPALAAGGLAGASWIGVWVLEPGLAVSGVMTRAEIWQLTVFTEAVLVLLVALSVWIGRKAGSRGVRDVERDGASGALEALEEAGDSGAGPGWATRFGLTLMTIYAAGWMTTGLLK